MAFTSPVFRPLTRFGGTSPSTVIGELTLVGPASYTSGGEAVTAASLGFSSISTFLGATIDNGTAEYHLTLDSTNNKIRAWDEAGTEVSGAVDLSTFTFTVLVVGVLASP